MTDPWPPRPPGPEQPPAADRGPGDAAGAPRASDDRPTSPDGRPSPDRRALGIALVAVGAIVVIAVLVGGSTPPGGATFPPVGATTGTAGSATAVTRGDVARALAAQGIQVEDTARPYRPAEAPAFATAPRLVIRAILPDDPDHGLLVIYEFADPAAASAAAEEQAAYIASGVGRVQFPNDARFVIRVVGSTVVFFVWAPSVSTDPRTQQVTTALEGLGAGVTVPG
jgi:hypothetical protein